MLDLVVVVVVDVAHGRRRQNNQCGHIGQCEMIFCVGTRQDLRADAPEYCEQTRDPANQYSITVANSHAMTVFHVEVQQ